MPQNTLDTIPKRLDFAADNSDTGIIFVGAKGEENFRSWMTIRTHAISTAVFLENIAKQNNASLATEKRVAIILPTCPEFFDVFFGCQYIGAVPVPLYPPLRLGKMSEYIEKTVAMLAAADVQMLITNKQISRILGEVVAKYSLPLGLHIVENIPYSKSSVQHDYQNQSPDHLAMAQFSSGTTVSPKPVGLTHQQVLANTDIILDHVQGMVGCSWLPLYHDMGLIGCVFPAFSKMGTLVLIPPEEFLRRPAIWLQAISKHKAYISPAPNFAYSYCSKRIQNKDLEGVDLSCWKMALNGAEAVSPAHLREFTTKFGKYGFAKEALTPVYGLAEASLAVTFSAPHTEFISVYFDREKLLHGQAVRCTNTNTQNSFDLEPYVELASVGKPLREFFVEIRDEQNTIVPDTTIGTIHIRGPSVMRGYLNQAQTGIFPIQDGWLDTGDMGFFFEGNLYIYGRKKDVIVLNGQNHAPQDLEQAVDEIDGVRQGCSVAVGDTSSGGEKVYMFVETVYSTPKNTEIAELCRKAISAKTGIDCDLVVILQSGTIPRTSSGKLRRKETLRLFQLGQLLPPKDVNMWNMAGVLAKSAWGYLQSNFTKKE